MNISITVFITNKCNIVKLMDVEAVIFIMFIRAMMVIRVIMVIKEITDTMAITATWKLHLL